MPFPPVDKIHLTFQPTSSTLADALAETRAQLAGLGGFTIAVVEFDGGSCIDVDAIPANAPLALQLWRKEYGGGWHWELTGPNGVDRASSPFALTMLGEVINFLEIHGNPTLSNELFTQWRNEDL